VAPVLRLRLVNCTQINTPTLHQHQNDSPGQCGPSGEIVGCRQQCIEGPTSECYNDECERAGGLCNNVMCASEADVCRDVRVSCGAPTLASSTTVASTAAPTPNDYCTANCDGFGVKGTMKWCNCCKNDCFGALQACKDNDGWCMPT
jgi:hypothetical protein